VNVSVLASMDPRLYQDQVNAALKASARAPHPASPPALMVKYSALPKVSASLRIDARNLAVKLQEVQPAV